MQGIPNKKVKFDEIILLIASATVDMSLEAKIKLFEVFNIHGKEQGWLDSEIEDVLDKCISSDDFRKTLLEFCE